MVATQGATASFLLYCDYVFLLVHINDLECFLEEKSVKLSGRRLLLKYSADVLVMAAIGIEVGISAFGTL